MDKWMEVLRKCFRCHRVRSGDGGVHEIFMNFSRLEIWAGRGKRGNVRRTSTTSARPVDRILVNKPEYNHIDEDSHMILMMMLSGLLFFHDSQMAITPAATLPAPP